MHAIGLNRPSRFCDSTAPSPLSDGSSSTVKSFDYTYRRKAWSCQLCPGSSGTQAFDRLASLLTVLRTAPRPTCLGVLVVARSAEQVSCKKEDPWFGLICCHLRHGRISGAPSAYTVCPSKSSLGGKWDINFLSLNPRSRSLRKTISSRFRRLFHVLTDDVDTLDWRCWYPLGRELGFPVSPELGFPATLSLPRRDL